MRKKIYGCYQRTECPFCNQTALTKNSQGVPVCIKHKAKKVPDLRCLCGEYLDLKVGKYGAYFLCMTCGNISMSKAKEMNPYSFD